MLITDPGLLYNQRGSAIVNRLPNLQNEYKVPSFYGSPDEGRARLKQIYKEFGIKKLSFDQANQVGGRRSAMKHVVVLSDSETESEQEWYYKYNYECRITLNVKKFYT